MMNIGSNYYTDCHVPFDLFEQSGRVQIAFDRFEPSGRVHIAEGVAKANYIKNMITAGCHPKIWIADLSAKLNNKLGGDAKKIQTVGNYFIQILAALLGRINLEVVEMLWASDVIESRPDSYWPLVLNVARRITVSRVERCIEITGVCGGSELLASHIVCTIMQCADILFMEADICPAGVYNEEVVLLATQCFDIIQREQSKPLTLANYTDTVPPLQQGQEKTNDLSSIFMDDEEAVVNVKIKKAFCPPKVVNENPCLEYIRCIIFPWFNEFVVERSDNNGGWKTFTSFEELISDYEKGNVHPADLKPALAKAINKILQPVRDHFKEDSAAKELLRRVKSYKVNKNVSMGNILVEPPSINSGDQKISSRLSNGITENGILRFGDDKAASAKTVKRVIQSDEFKNGATPWELREKLEDYCEEFTFDQPLDKKIFFEECYDVLCKFYILNNIGEEILTADELLHLIIMKPDPVAYDGFEPSGRMHIAQGILKAINVNKLTSSGCRVKIWIADWFAQLNNKMDGDLKKIEVVGNYFKEIWKALGMKLVNNKVEFLLSSEEINSRSREYWPLVLDIARRNTLSRIINSRRCCQIMGRSDKDQLTAAQIFYPCMQCADIFFLKADICQLGMDQRKVNVLAREYSFKSKRKDKPIIISHHMIPGLRQGQEKMSKSDPSSAIYMEDEKEAVNAKIQMAYCPPKVVAGNPCLEYIQYIIFPWFSQFKINRSENGGLDKIYENFKDLADDYETGELHPNDVKCALSIALNQILEPVRGHFKSNPTAKALLETVKGYQGCRIMVANLYLCWTLVLPVVFYVVV